MKWIRVEELVVIVTIRLAMIICVIWDLLCILNIFLIADSFFGLIVSILLFVVILIFSLRFLSSIPDNSPMLTVIGGSIVFVFVFCFVLFWILRFMASYGI